MKQARTFLLRGSTALSALIALALPRAAQAQADVTVPLTNALLLIDTSGSMEYKADGTQPTCNPASTASLNERSRWTDLVEVMTGTIDNYTCQAIDRTDSGVGFKTGEYQLGGTPPYDYLYPLAYHRPLSNGCAPAPGVQSSNPFIYPASGAVKFHQYNSTTTCAFGQHGNDGVLDGFRSLARFALMTFDTSIDAGTGYSGTMAAASVNASTGKAGLWSYVPNGVATGKPADCAGTAPDQEVGARNAAAPAWEGRMVNFSNPYDAVRAYETKNDRIQEILLATRPYGATPIAGMLQDASDFLLVDATKDPDRIPAGLADSDIASDFGPRQDPYLKCPLNPRQQIIILITDGQPNLDLRPYCESTTGKCPFTKPEEIALELNTLRASHNPIPTYVVGFALDKVDHDNNPGTAPFDCNDLTDTQVARSTTSLCGNPANADNAPLQACCNLQRIAIAGGTRAHFATNSGNLRSYIIDILGGSLKTTSRTQAVASSGTGGSAGGGYQFFTGFVPTSGEAWRGTLERRRIICNDPDHLGVPWPQEILETKGDKFARNLAVGGPNARRIYTVLGGALVSDPLYPSNTIRPLFGSTDKDGVGTYGGRYFSGNSRNFIDNLPTAASAIPTPSCVDQAGTVLTAAACQKQFLDWWAGYNNGQTLVKQRCPSVPTDCNLLGDIMHSTPVVVDRPIASIRDESYTRFTEMQKLRPKVLYTSTNDGMLHAFKVSSNDPAEATDETKKVLTNGASNELWAFVPPAVLPNLYSLYPASHQMLLDGIPVVRDVVAVPNPQADKAPVVFERTRAAAQDGSSLWRTILVQGFGGAQTGYFAVNVTNPVPSTSDPDDVNKGGARMLWQITTDKANAKLFGRGGSTPTITTLYFDPAGGTDVREIPVAILPGGPGGTQVTSGNGCPGTARTFTDVTLDSAYPPRGKVHCYTFSNDTGARSLTIVRLDTGEIVRTFRQLKTEVHVSLQPRVTEVGIDSPITGQPVAFPNSTGEVADRIFVGDDDGRLWRVNVASTKPADWTMKLFMDLYPSSFGASPGKTWADGQPISVPPVVSVDLENNLVINVATGNQDSLGAAPGQSNFVYSLTEKINAARTGYSTKVNWYTQFTNGTRVVGPMVLFNGGLYFGTYAPAVSTQVCDVGVSEIWGVNYLVPKTPATLSDGGKVLDGFSSQVIQSVTSAVAFGPAIMQTPSCATEVDSLLGDGVLGFGHRVSLTNIQTGGFQLVFQTGSNTTSSAVGSSSVGVRSINLPTPPALSTISAWASIVE